jgi:hypothetical protein
VTTWQRARPGPCPPRARTKVIHGGTLQQTPICALNRVRADVATPLAGLTTVPGRAVVVAGAASRGGNDPGQGAGRVLMGTGNPNDNQLAGNLGDVYRRVDPESGAEAIRQRRQRDPRHRLDTQIDTPATT